MGRLPPPTMMSISGVSGNPFRFWALPHSPPLWGEGRQATQRRRTTVAIDYRGQVVCLPACLHQLERLRCQPSIFLCPLWELIGLVSCIEDVLSFVSRLHTFHSSVRTSFFLPLFQTAKLRGPIHRSPTAPPVSACIRSKAATRRCTSSTAGGCHPPRLAVTRSIINVIWSGLSFRQGM